MTKYIIYLAVFAFLLFSCKRNPLKVDISDSGQEVEIIRFGEALFNFDSSDTVQHLIALSNKYPDFFNLFTHHIIRVGGIGDEHFTAYMKRFLTDSTVLLAKERVDRDFDNFAPIEKQLKTAFKYFKFHFPENDLPTIYTYISGFNQAVVTGENLVGISLDKYLGRNCELYQQLGDMPQYKILNMHPGMIAPDVAYAWATTLFEHTNTATTLVDNMIHQGKLMYFVDAMLPETPDSLKMGYSEAQTKWCENNEAQMWGQLIEREMLFSNKRMDIIRYNNPSPTTSGFSLESPGRTGVWIGWQIVRKYMAEHPEMGLRELMGNSNYREILNQSGYFPE